MSFKKLAIAGGVTASLLASTAYASVLDRPFFQVLGVVLVWGGDTAGQAPGANPVVSDFVLLTPASGNAGADLIGGTATDVHAIVTGTLDPISGATANPVNGGTFTDNGTAGVLDALDTLTAFGIDANTDVDGLVGDYTSSFYVASNAAFNIHAQSTPATTTGDFSALDTSDISFGLGITVADAADATLPFGSAAQNPGTIDSVADLGVMENASTKVFTGTQRTAASVGSIAAQSVRFDATYGLVGGYDLSQGVGSITSDVTYTIFVP